MEGWRWDAKKYIKAYFPVLKPSFRDICTRELGGRVGGGCGGAAGSTDQQLLSADHTLNIVAKRILHRLETNPNFMLL